MTPSAERVDAHATVGTRSTPDAVARALQPVVSWAEEVTRLPVVHDWPDAARTRPRASEGKRPSTTSHDAPADAHDQADAAIRDEPDEAVAPSVVLYPFAIEPVAAAATLAHRARGAELTLRVLVTATGDPHDIASVTADLALDAALAELNVETGAVDVAFWQALGRRPAPAFVLAIPIRRSLELPSAPPVRSRRLVVTDTGTAQTTTVGNPPATADDITATADDHAATIDDTATPARGTTPGTARDTTPAASVTALTVPSTSTH